MRPLPDRRLVLADLSVDPDGRVNFPVFDGEDDVPCRFRYGVLESLAKNAGRDGVNARDSDDVRALLAAFTERVAVRFGWVDRVIVVDDVEWL